MKSLRSRILTALACAVLTVVGLSSTTSTPASATITPLKMVVFQGNLTAWVDRDGLGTVATELAQADILVITNAFLHTYGGSEWVNQRGCQDLQDDHDAWVDVLDYVNSHAGTLGALPKVFGYVSGPADAPDQSSGGVTREAFCGNTVNNFRSAIGDPIVEWPPGSGHYTELTHNTVCPSYLGTPGVCKNFIDWVDQWTNPSDAISQYIDGIFIDYVSAEKMSSAIRDSIYSYVHLVGRDIMVNSTIPGPPCVNCTSVNGDSGSVWNYEFAADSSYLTADDYVMVEGYYWAGFSGNGGVATDKSTETKAIAQIRDDLEAEHGVKPRIAALITEPTDAAFTSLSCSWADYTSARSEFMSSAITGDAISYQFSDYGTVGEGPNRDGAPVFPIPYCG